MGRLVDVFRPATEYKERIAAGDLEPGMLMVVLVDDPYEDVFNDCSKLSANNETSGRRWLLHFGATQSLRLLLSTAATE